MEDYIMLQVNRIQGYWGLNSLWDLGCVSFSERFSWQAPAHQCLQVHFASLHSAVKVVSDFICTCPVVDVDYHLDRREWNDRGER